MNVLFWKFTPENIIKTGENVGTLRNKYLWQESPSTDGTFLGLDRSDHEQGKHIENNGKYVTVTPELMHLIRQ